MAEISRANPGMPLFLAWADHAAGVFGGDHARLERAFALHDDPWARASAAEDLGALAVDVRRKAAVSWLDRALDAYVSSGAERDAARIRHKLRRLGVRRKHWHAMKRPETGWESLTQTERSVAGLVATGLTNQQVADQMFISTHTVAFHLRQVFRKLSIRSRVELARAAVERPGQHWGAVRAAATFGAADGVRPRPGHPTRHEPRTRDYDGKKARGIARAPDTNCTRR